LDIGRDGREDYALTVYSKGAWVIHMLRNLMLDHDTGSEELFDGFMKALFDRFKDRTISTGEFRALLEAYLQTDMGWFFDQWVYGTDIPTYHFAYTTEELPDGEVRMRVRIR
jgi:aminopeptidase N